MVDKLLGLNDYGFSPYGSYAALQLFFLRPRIDEDHLSNNAINHTLYEEIQAKYK